MDWKKTETRLDATDCDRTAGCSCPIWEPVQLPVVWFYYFYKKKKLVALSCNRFLSIYINVLAATRAMHRMKFSALMLFQVIRSCPEFPDSLIMSRQTTFYCRATWCLGLRPGRQSSKASASMVNDWMVWPSIQFLCYLSSYDRNIYLPVKI